MKNNRISETLKKILFYLGSFFLISSLLLIALFPSIEIVTRFFNTGIYSSSDYVSHLVIWVAFLGGITATVKREHLSLSIATTLIKGRKKEWLDTFTAAISSSVSILLAVSSYNYMQLAFFPDQKAGIIPIKFVFVIMPLGFAAMAVLFFLRSPKSLKFRLITLAGPLLTGVISFSTLLQFPLFVWIISIVLLLGAFLGAPIFIMMGGIAIVLFVNSGGTVSVIPNEVYTMLKGPIMPTIPLFALAGFILSESNAGERLLKLLRSLFGWLPGGLAIVTILIMTFFTTLAGSSSVTILALGGLLYYILSKHNYSDKFSTGILTVNGIGTLLPPSLPVIMFGVTAQINIKHMFIAGLLPGALMILTLIIISVITAFRNRIPRTPFEMKRVLPNLKHSFGELLLPFLIIGCYFGGLTTLIETSAITLIYVFVLEVLIHRDIPFAKLAGVFSKAISVIGAILIILSIAKALSYYIVDAGIPLRMTEWIRSTIESKYLFLILLNILLLITGCLMDVFSAIIVIVPLILPLAKVYGIEPIHLGIIFLANLELGYLTPPVGLNLFFTSIRLDKPLIYLYKTVLPFLAALFIAVLLITYIPWFSTVLLDIFVR